MAHPVLTPEEIARRTELACEAAFTAASDLDLEVTDTEVLHEAFSVVVRLAPTPVVARIPVVHPPGVTAEQVEERQCRELDVAGWLDEHGVPTTRPSPLVPPEPVRQDGFAITFWELVETTPDHQAYRAADPEVAAALHLALAAYPGELPFLAPFNGALPAMVEAAEGSPLLSAQDVDRLHAQWHALAPVLADEDAFQARFGPTTVQPIQGDAPVHNVIRSPRGLLFADFEDVCRGPVEWDLAGLGAEAVAAYDDSVENLDLRRTDPRLVEAMDAARRVQAVASLCLVPQLPLLEQGLAPLVQQWREQDVTLRI